MRVDLENNTLHTDALPPLHLSCCLAELAHVLVDRMPDYASTDDITTALYGKQQNTGYRMAIMRLRKAIARAGIEIIYNPDKGYFIRRMVS